jgi:hypothetical protein
MKKIILFGILFLFIFTMSSCRSTYNELQIDTDDFMIENEEINNYREVTGMIRSIDNRLKDEYGVDLALYESEAIEYSRSYDSETYPIPVLSDGILMKRSLEINDILQNLEMIVALIDGYELTEESTYISDGLKLSLIVNENSFSFSRTGLMENDISYEYHYKLIITEDNLLWERFGRSGDSGDINYRFFDFEKGFLQVYQESSYKDVFVIKKGDFVINMYESFYFSDDRISYGLYDIAANSSYDISTNLNDEENYRILFYDDNKLDLIYTKYNLNGEIGYSIAYNIEKISGYDSYSDNKFYDDQGSTIGSLNFTQATPFNFLTAYIGRYNDEILNEDTFYVFNDVFEYTGNTTYADIERELDNLKKLEGDFSISNNDETIEYRLFGKSFTLDKVAEEFASEMPEPYLEQFKSND